MEKKIIQYLENKKARKVKKLMDNLLAYMKKQNLRSFQLYSFSIHYYLSKELAIIQAKKIFKK